MQFSQLCRYFGRLEATPSRNEMTAILAELLKKADPEEIDKICYLSLGRLGPLYESLEFNLAEKMIIRILSQAYNVSKEEVKKQYGQIGDLGDVAANLSESKKLVKKVDVSGIFDQLGKIALASGTGSQEVKIRLMVNLLKSLDAAGAKYAVRIPLKKLRLGFSDLTILDALSWMETGDKSLRKKIEAAHNVSADIGKIARLFKAKGIKGLEKIEVEVGVPILPTRCQRLNSAEDILEKTGGRAGVEPKFDGSRAQVHIRRDKGIKPARIATRSVAGGGLRDLEGSQTSLLGDYDQYLNHVRIFSRNLEDMTRMFPDLAEAVFKQVKAKEAIFDGEALGYDEKSGRFLPFQETIQRKRKYGVKEKMAEVPLKLFLFDLLAVDGKSLLNEPFEKRRRMLEKSVLEGETVQLTPQQVVEDSKKLQKIFKEAVDQGLEGLVVKNLGGIYEAGARGFNWIKFKGAMDTIDCVVLGYYYGRGKRSGFGIGAFLVGVYDADKDLFRTIAKIGTGLSDEQWRELQKRCQRIKAKEKPARFDVAKELTPNFWVEPEIVVEIRADEITKSPLHTAGKIGDQPGFALRFPRLISFRDDKSPEDATTVSEVISLAKFS